MPGWRHLPCRRPVARLAVCRAWPGGQGGPGLHFGKGGGIVSPCQRIHASVASPIICRSALAIGAHRGVAALANTLGIGCALRLALRSDGCAQPATSDR
ncbi:hypothetical protein [Verminephrobacter eiseniae]|nr:hypothetical protein [Verminephrobacter eiseniae]